MRRPTPAVEQYAWHTMALAAFARFGDLRKAEIEIDANTPQPGWYQRRIVRDGPYVPVEIWLEQIVEDGELLSDERLRCTVSGRDADPFDQWTFVAKRPITAKQFRHMSHLERWTKANAPEEPLANPGEPVNHLKTPIPF